MNSRKESWDKPMPMAQRDKTIAQTLFEWLGFFVGYCLIAAVTLGAIWLVAFLFKAVIALF